MMNPDRFSNLPSTMNKEAFLEHFAGVYEHSAWVAQTLWDEGITEQHDSIEILQQSMRRIVDTAGNSAKMTLIRNHPDLAGKAAIRGELTNESTTEQASAGLDQCSARELETFTRLNDQYKEKFDFPFIMAVRNSNRHKILAAFGERLENTPEAEFQRAMEEIHDIALFRLQEI